MSKKQIAIVASKAAKLLRENPEWTYKKAIDKAKEMVLSENYRETQRNISTTRD